MPKIRYLQKSIIFSTFAWFLSCNFIFAQTAKLEGKLVDAKNNEAIPFASVFIQNTTIGTTSDLDGYFVLENLEPGLYNVEASCLAFKSKVIYEVEVFNNRPSFILFELESSEEELEEVVVKAKAFNKVEETPLSIRSIGINEIQRYPGGNRDLSKVIQSLPGVASSVSFRNDIIIRGGAPSENRFYLEDIEIPTINHFSTQGASGGPVGMINVDFIREVDFMSGAFPANRGNSLSSIMNIKLIDGRDDRPGATFTIGASEVAAAFETPLKDKGNLIFAARTSYLQLLFKALGLPFLPTYNDFQFKTKLKLNTKNELTILGLGAIDIFKLNLDANETPDQQYVLGYLPDNDQWNYTIGLRHKLFLENSYWTFIASRSMFNNRVLKYQDNDDSSEDNLNLKIVSQEIDNKFRVENTARIKSWKYTFGLGGEISTYKNSTFNKLYIPNVGEQSVSFNSNLVFGKYNAFGQLSRGFFNERLDLSLGLRIDGASYNKSMANPFRQFSPRFSLNFGITERLSLNFNSGIYFQLPAYTLLGYEDSEGNLLNQNALQFINNKQVVLGLEYATKKNSKLSAEAFLKLYDNYPFLLSDSISFANLGGDFGIIGSDLADASSEGRSYGLELLFQQKLFKGWYGIVAYTLYWSEFKDKKGDFVPSAWDARHIISLTGGKKFNKNWEIGARWGLQGGSPYTPYDLSLSAIPENWDASGRGTKNYDLLNSERTKWTHQLNVRIDKRWFFQKWSLNLYLDVQNVYNFKGESAPEVNVERDANGIPLLNSNGSYSPYTFTNEIGVLLPSIGIVVKI
ncbi:MAG: TonB-dependent receptor [Chitinophagales bacterium]|nr:TonB-dependent receptor [Chitinophagales bacterium]